MKIIINASNIHVGGGKTLLDNFLRSSQNFKSKEYIIFVDYRYKITIESKNISYQFVNKYNRFFVTLKIKKLVNRYDKIIYFGNLPPAIRVNHSTILILSSRFFLENFSLNGFSIFTKIQIFLERLFFNLFIKNISTLIVQSESMYDLAKKNKNIKCKITIKALGIEKKQNANKKQILENINDNCFLYVASNQNYKNHINLIKAWIYLKSKSIQPSLKLTIQAKGQNYKKIIQLINDYKLNIKILPNLSREELINCFKKSNILIYPSLFESYGLPLVEARYFGLNIVASELDFVRDFIDPDETFDPNSYKSIARSVLRLFNFPYERTKILNSDDFTKYIFEDI